MEIRRPRRPTGAYEVFDETRGVKDSSIGLPADKTIKSRQAVRHRSRGPTGRWLRALQEETHVPARI